MTVTFLSMDDDAWSSIVGQQSEQYASSAQTNWVTRE